MLSSLRALVTRPASPRRRPAALPRRRPLLEALEDRLAPAVQLMYGGPGSVLSLLEQVSGATPAVTISEPTPGRLEIDLGAQTFDPTSTAQATGLAYQSPGAPQASHFATLDIGQANNVATLQAALDGDWLTLGVIANASGGLGNVAASAGTITVTGLDTSHAAVGQGNVDLRAAGWLTVAPNALLDTGTGTIALAADVNADGTGNSNSGVLFIARGATVVSDNAGRDAITLRGADIDIDTYIANPAIVGARRVALPTTPGATLTELNGPSALAFDALGNLFVANTGPNGNGGSTVSVFAPGRTTPTTTLAGLSTPNALAVDASGNLYVTNFSGNSVSVFAPDGTPIATFTGGLNGPRALAFDAAGYLFVANTGPFGGNKTVSKFAPDGTPIATLAGLNGPRALAVDTLSNLYVTNFSGNSVSVFDLGSTTPTATLVGVNAPDALGFDASGNLYVTNFFDNTISVFAPGRTTPTYLLAGSGSGGPRALAFDAKGNIFVASRTRNTVDVFLPGRTTPTATLTGLDGPVALAVDARGNLFVANRFHNTVSTFTPTNPSPVAGGVVIRSARPDQPITLGATNPGALTVGDDAQTGTITFAAATRAATPGASVVAR
jgi:hypothetical protein